MYPARSKGSGGAIEYAFDRRRFHDTDRLEMMSALKSLVGDYKTFVKAEIGKVRALAMTDSGNSAYTSVNRDLAEALGICSDDLESVDGRDSIGTAKSDSRMKILGRTKKEYDIHLSPSLPAIRTKLVVLPELGMPCNISGIDLQRYAVTIVTGHHLLYQGVKIPLISRRDFSSEISVFSPRQYTVNSTTRSPIFTRHDVTIRPFERVHVGAIIPEREGGVKSGEASVIPSVLFQEKFELAPWRNAVITIRNGSKRDSAYNTCKIGMINATQHSIKVPKGTHYGDAEEIICHEVSDSNEPSISNISTNEQDPSNSVPASVSNQKKSHRIPTSSKTDFSDSSSASNSNRIPTSKTAADLSDSSSASNSHQKKPYRIPPSPDKQSDPMSGDDVDLPVWMEGETNKGNWEPRFLFLRKLFKTTENPNLKHKEDEKQFLVLLLHYWDLFAWRGQYGRTSLIKHYIKTPPGGRPVNERYRPPNPVLSESLKKQIEKWLKDKVIEPSDSSWNSNLLAVVKANDPGAVRWCVDYRKLNSETQIDRFPIGDIQDNLSRLGKSKLFSCLDNSGAFHSIEIATEDRHKTSFCSPFNVWQFTCLPFGLSGGPSSYARLVLQVLRNIPPEVAVAYVDDILIHSEHFKQHLTNLDAVFRSYDKAGLKLNPKKCAFLRSEIDYLGHSVSSAGIRPQDAYLKIVQTWPQPKTRHDISVLLGKTGYYRKFIPNYAKIAKPLTDRLKLDDNSPSEKHIDAMGSALCRQISSVIKQAGDSSASSGKTGQCAKKKQEITERIILSKSQRRKRMEEPIVLTKEEIESFNLLKKALCSPPTLGHPRFDDLVKEPFILDTDWCSETNTVSGVLSQIQLSPRGEEVEKVIGYSSKKLNKSQANYSSPKGEICAILLMIENFKYFLLIGRFKIRTDNMAAKALRDNLQPTGFLSRWKSRLASYDFEITHRAGTRHGNADSLSRITHAEPLTSDVDVFDEQTDRQYLFHMSIDHIDDDESKGMSREEQWTSSYIKEIQEEDPDLLTLREWVRLGEIPTTQDRAAASRDLKSYINLFKDLSLDQDDVLRYNHSRSPIDEGFDVSARHLIILPTNSLTDAVRLIHSKHSHVGVQNTIDASLNHVYGHDLRDVVEYVCQTCLVCQQKGGKPKKNDHTLYVPRNGYPMQTLNLDFVGPLTPSKRKQNVYLLTVQCAFTRWLEAFPMKRATGANVVHTLVTEVFPRFGYPSFLKIDRGTHFLNKEVQELTDLTGIRVLTSPAYHPCSNIIERSHRTLKSMLHAMILDLSQGDPSSWEEHLPACLFSFRCLRNKRTGFSPFELLFVNKPQTELTLIFGPPPDRKEYSSKRSFALAHQHHMQQAYEWANKNMSGELVRARKYHYASPKRTYSINDKVWLLTPVVRPGQRKSFISPFTGPWVIVKKINEVVYEIAPHHLWSRKKNEVVTADRLKPYVAPSGEGEEDLDETHPPSMNQDLSLASDQFLERLPLSGNTKLDDDDDDEDEDGRLPPLVPQPRPRPQGQALAPPLQFGAAQPQLQVQPQQQLVQPPQPPLAPADPDDDADGVPELPQPVNDVQRDVDDHAVGQGLVLDPFQAPPREVALDEPEGQHHPAPRRQVHAPGRGRAPGARRQRGAHAERLPPRRRQPPRQAAARQEGKPYNYYKAERRLPEAEDDEDIGEVHQSLRDEVADGQFEDSTNEPHFDFPVSVRNESTHEPQPHYDFPVSIRNPGSVRNELVQSESPHVDLTDQSKVLLRRREFAADNDVRTRRQKRAQDTLDRLRKTKSKLVSQGKALSSQKALAEFNLARLAPKKTVSSPTRYAFCHNSTNPHDRQYEFECSALRANVPSFPLLHAVSKHPSHILRPSQSLVRKLATLQPSARNVSLNEKLNILKRRPGQNFSAAPPARGRSRLPRATRSRLATHSLPPSRSVRSTPSRGPSPSRGLEGPSRIPRAVKRHTSVPPN